jgi:rRNA processing protein Gar1
MIFAGEIIHLAKSGRLIIKLAPTGANVRSGEILFDETGRRTGKVIETIGPVSSPYASAYPLIDKARKLIGHRLFCGENQPKRQHKSNKVRKRFNSKVS